LLFFWGLLLLFGNSAIERIRGELPPEGQETLGFHNKASTQFISMFNEVLKKRLQIA
jgi:hypothetical protein